MNIITYFPIYSDYGSSILLVSTIAIYRIVENIIGTLISDLLVIISRVHE